MLPFPSFFSPPHLRSIHFVTTTFQVCHPSHAPGNEVLKLVRCAENQLLPERETYPGRMGCRPHIYATTPTPSTSAPGIAFSGILSCLLLKHPFRTLPNAQTLSGAAYRPNRLCKCNSVRVSPQLLLQSTQPPTLHHLTRTIQHKRPQHPKREVHSTASGQLQDPSHHNRSYLLLILAFSSLRSRTRPLHVAFSRM